MDHSGLPAKNNGKNGNILGRRANMVSGLRCTEARSVRLQVLIITQKLKRNCGPNNGWFLLKIPLEMRIRSWNIWDGTLTK